MEENKKRKLGRPNKRPELKKTEKVMLQKYYTKIELEQKGGKDAIRERMEKACKKI